MHESLFGPVGDERYSACLSQCEAVLERCAKTSSASAMEICEQNYQSCIEDCDREEGIVRL